MKRVRAASGLASDRVEIGRGGTPGFPDVVFWVGGVAVPVEFKVGSLTAGGMMRFELRPAQRLWWRHAALEERRCLLCAGAAGRLFWLKPVQVVAGAEFGLPAASLWTSSCDALGIGTALEDLHL